jgi:hypothetical protein
MHAQLALTLHVHACTAQQDAQQGAFLLLVRVTVDGTYPLPVHACRARLVVVAGDEEACVHDCRLSTCRDPTHGQGGDSKDQAVTLIPGVHARLNCIDIVSRPLAQLARATGTAAAALLAAFVIMAINAYHADQSYALNLDRECHRLPCASTPTNLPWAQLSTIEDANLVICTALTRACHSLRCCYPSLHCCPT